ncbi:MAG: NUDIX domain-containing protein [Curtobacterium sp.]
MAGPDPLRVRAAAVAVRDDAVLLVLRERDDRRYAVLPGGGVEVGETPQQACVRELREETGLDGEVLALLPVGLDREAPTVYLQVAVGTGTPTLDPAAPESARTTPGNRYRPAWVPLDRLEEVGLVPHRAVAAVRAAVSAGSTQRAAR